MSDVAPAVRLTFRSGGWILVVTAVAVSGLLLWAFAGVIAGHRPKGGGDLASYGFDLTTCLVAPDELTPTGQPRDFIRTLDVMSTMPASAMAEFNQTHRKRYVVSDDRVVGVTINGATRAYPLYIIEAHEIVTDTLGDTPIVVTYSPFCDAAAAYERTVDGKVLSFRVSGLVRNANTLMYDHRDDPREASSLWQQLDGRAIAGPAASSGRHLVAIPEICITTWSDWTTAHPESTVIGRDEGLVRLYDGISYRRAHESQDLGFPASPLPMDSQLSQKEPVVVVDFGGERKAYAIERARAASASDWTVRHGGTTLTLHLPAVRGAARLEAAPGLSFVATPSFWFAAYSTLGLRDGDLVVPEQPGAKSDH